MFVICSWVSEFEANATGLPACISVAPNPNCEASVSNKTGLLGAKYFRWRAGVLIMSPLTYWNAWA